MEQHIIFNKGAVMVLPINVNKSFGLQHALERLKLSPHNVVGIGDAENDQAFLGSCGCAVAVGNALPGVKEKCDYVAASFHEGVIEMCDRLIKDDLASFATSLGNHMPALGDSPDGTTVRLDPRGTTLIAGGSQAGKTTLVTAVIEQLSGSDFQYCIIDPEGDYSELRDAKVLGDSSHAPRIADVMELLENPAMNVVVNLLAVDLADRGKFVIKFLSELQVMRDGTGRPQWLILDEVHHFFDAGQAASITLPRAFPGVLAVTVHPNTVALDFLKSVTAMVGVGGEAVRALKEFCTATGWKIGGEIPPGQGLLLTSDASVKSFEPLRPSVKQPRHVRKYAGGELADVDSFYFTGPQGALKLRAKNLISFLELSEGVDQETWKHHLKAGDYSRWFREKIKDESLSADAVAVENDKSLSPEESFARIKEIVKRRYTAPAT